MIWLIMLVVVAFMSGALSHEYDMRRCIKKYGNTGCAGWLGKIKGFIAD